MKIFLILSLTLSITLVYAQEGSPSDSIDTEPEAITTIGVFLSPVTISRVNDEKDITYGLQFARDVGKHEYRGFYEHNEFSSTDPLNLITVKSAQHQGIFTYDYNKFWGDFTYFLLGSYERRREGDIQILEHQIRAGVLGIKYDIYEGKTLRTLDLSYIPLYELIEENPESPDSSLINPIFQHITTRNIRHSIRFRFKLRFQEPAIDLENTFFWRPATFLTGNKKGSTSFRDVDLENRFKFSYKLTSLFALTYRNIYTWDVRQKEVLGLPTSDMVHKFLIEFNKTF